MCVWCVRACVCGVCACLENLCISVSRLLRAAAGFPSTSGPRQQLHEVTMQHVCICIYVRMNRRSRARASQGCCYDGVIAGDVGEAVHVGADDGGAHGECYSPHGHPNTQLPRLCGQPLPNGSGRLCTWCVLYMHVLHVHACITCAYAMSTVCSYPLSPCHLPPPPEPHEQNSPHLISLMQEVLNLLNMCSSEKGLSEQLLVVMLDVIEQLPQSNLIALSTITAGETGAPYMWHAYHM